MKISLMIWNIIQKFKKMRSVPVGYQSIKEKYMCKYCENKEVLVEKEHLSTNIIGWNANMLATELLGSEYYESVFIDRGYLRMVGKDDCNCLDHGDKIKINYCPMCGRKL